MEEMTETMCAVCGGTGWEVVQEAGISRAKRCSCRQTGNTDKFFSTAKIPIRYQSCEFDNFLPQHPSHERAKEMAKNYAEYYPVLDDEKFQEGGLLFSGLSGRGKTHLAVAILKRLLQKGISCLFVDFHELLAEIRNTYDPLSQASEFQVMRPVLNAEVLLLDDLGSQRMSEWVADTVFHVINLRYSQRKALIATTNLIMEPDKKTAEESLQDRLGYRVVSRLYEMCTGFELQGPDYRKDVRKVSRDFLRSKPPLD